MTLQEINKRIHSISTPVELESSFNSIKSDIDTILSQSNNPFYANYYKNHTGRELFRKLYNFNLSNLIYDDYDSGFRPLRFNFFNELFNPSLLGSGLAAWYDAADTSTITTSSGGNDVTQMNDKSSNGFNLTVINSARVGPDSGTRTLNGLNVLDYDKVSVSSPQVLEVNNFNKSNPVALSMLIHIDDEAIASDQDFFISFTDTLSPRLGLRRTSADGFQVISNSGSVGSGSVMTEPGTYLVTVYFNGTSASARLQGSFLNIGNIANNTLENINLGANFNEVGQLDGCIAETVIYDSNSDITKVEGYLAHKWGVANLLPSNHLYKNNPPIIQ